LSRKAPVESHGAKVLAGKRRPSAHLSGTSDHGDRDESQCRKEPNMSQFPPTVDVEDVVADGDIHLRSSAGASRRVRVKVGRPRHLSDVPEDDWVCPVWMEGVAEGVKCFGGVGPIDSLLNATEWLRSRSQEAHSGR
jgi:hypothetical protein